MNWLAWAGVAAALAGCGGASASPDAAAGIADAAAGIADAAAPDGAATAAGTWDDPIEIGPLPYLAASDSRGRDSRAASYDCAPGLDAGGGEVVYRLTLAEAAKLRIGLDDRDGDGVDLDLLVASAPPDGRGRVTGCAARADVAAELSLAAGSWFVVADASAAPDSAGAFLLSIVHADPGGCLDNPLPACTAESTPDVNGLPIEPPGLGGCPAGMAAIGAEATPFCIDRWEAAVFVDSLEPSGWSPYANPGSVPVRAVAAPGLVPQGYISGTQAAAACERAGKRLCSDAEWLRACQGAAGHTFPYGDSRIDAACNDARDCHPAVQYFESSEAWVFSELDHPCIGQLPDGLAPTGSYAACASDDGIWDLMGNLHEWTADPAGTFRGGFYVDTAINGPGCLYQTTAHDTSHWDYSTGFRCCTDL
jgi:sulfatase-modifying factor enzyme 1